MNGTLGFDFRHGVVADLREVVAEEDDAARDRIAALRWLDQQLGKRIGGAVMPGSKGFELVGNVPAAGFKRHGSNRWVRWSHVLAYNAQMRAHARRVRAHLDAEGQKLDGAATAVEQLAEQFADEGRGEEQARIASTLPNAQDQTAKKAKTDGWCTVIVDCLKG
ncbi:hypothetical protein N2600_04305 [Rhizobium sp. WSM1274]|uniref:hypothetical protein n=1 Tax=Rhizobium sp. WSM1274 TaxID=3138254 RepID=UPI0021A2937A|nr:hypothetical protein [Rhizobium leguminosarum]UWU29198.1 hypothetical protein N2600_04305 [Rhizobium leguminosarum bv. viciae]